VLFTRAVPFARPRDYAGIREQPGYAAIFRELYTAMEPA
jgi:hypothetical protein